MRIRRAFAFAACLFVSLAAHSGSQAGSVGYRVPPEPIASALEAPAPPLVLLNPTRSHIAIVSQPGLPSILELAEPELGLAGTTINPRNNGPSRTIAHSAVTFVDLGTARRVAARVPSGARLSSMRWSRDGRRLAFLLLKEDTVELWAAAAATGEARRLASGVNAAFPNPYEWLPDSSGMIVRLIPGGRGTPPEQPNAPDGPVVRESRGEGAPTQTIQNLLANAHDEALFEYYFTSQLALVGLGKDEPRPIGEPGLIVGADPSPDGGYILQRRLKRPFSYALGASAFAQEEFVTDRAGRRLAIISDRTKPLVSQSEVPAEPRAVQWRADAPATLFWAVRAGDGPDRDRLFLLDAPFSSKPRLLADLPIRFQRILWGAPEISLVIGVSRSARAEQRIVVDPSGRLAPRLLQERPFGGGSEAGAILEWGEDMLHLTADSSAIMVELPDALARLSISSGRLDRLWTEGPRRELFAPVERDGQRLLVWIESGDAPANLFLVRSGGGEAIGLTSFPDPAPAYAGMQARRLNYERSDGRRLSGTLYLPPGYSASRDGPIPTLVWAYPGSVTGARELPEQGEIQRFIRPRGFDDLHLLLTGRGYAVFEADMPIFGSAGSHPNDTHVPQLVANAEAAVSKLVGLGITARDRLAIGGHSFGAAMVANLLAHSDLFRTGIALSGAYNRTLTPFGFQATEDRSLWEAPDAYLAMSPFIHADRIDEPILLFHGTADSNSGTLPMQSERLFSAISGLGGTARYVLLPAEGHNYRARETLMHVMWEIDRWLAEHLPRDKPPLRAE